MIRTGVSKNIKSLKQQAGFSLVELMVSIAVSVILLSGVMEVIINTSQSYRIQNGIMRVQENGQFAMEFMAKDLRNTAFWGCITDLDNITNRLNTGGGGYDPTFNGFQSGIDGTENESGGGNALAGTDTITVRGAVNLSGGLSLQPPYGPLTTSPINVGPNTNIQNNETLLISDCLNGDFFQVTNITPAGAVSHDAGVGSPGNASAELSKVYTGEAFVYRPYTHIYDIRTGASGLPALFRTDEDGAQELVEGVESMVVLYGEDTTNDGNANRYVRANGVTDMNNVVSIRISLLIQSIDDFLSVQAQPYTFNGQTVTPADNRLRRVYTSTILLRNRGT